MKRLLLVAYEFPPMAGAGVFRPLRLSKYLPRHGWQVTVLTVSQRVRTLKDEALLREVPVAGVRIERTLTLEPRPWLLALNRLGLGPVARRISPWFMIPDEQRGWVPFAVARARSVLRKLPHDAMVTTAAPYSAHLIGLSLARRTGIPWVADFRDEWSANPYLAPRYPSRWHRRLNRRLEGEVLRGADRVVSVSRPWLDSLHSLAPERSSEHFVVLPNGYDAEHFPMPRPAPPRDRFRVVYTGTFYGHRSPVVFLEGLRRALASERVPAARTEVWLVGHGGQPSPVVRGLDPAQIRVLGQRPYHEALAMLADAAVLLLVIPPEGGPGNHTGKLFPYLASGRPILALAPEPNVAADLIRQSCSGRVVAPDDPDAVAAALAELYADWQRERPSTQDRSKLLPYAADPQAADWARMLDDLVAERTAGVGGRHAGSQPAGCARLA